MRRCLVLLLPVTLTAVIAQAQLVNNGATIKIQPGAIVFVAGDVQNNSSGTISNDGKLEVQGSFTNAATYTTATADDSLIMSGGGNVLLNTGGATLSFLHINKTANTNFVTLVANAVIGGKLTYNSGTLSTDPIANTYTLSAASSVPFEFTAGREIVGRVRRTGWANGAAVVFNQPNMLVTTNGGTNPTEFTVNMIPQVNGGDPTQAEREVKRRYVFSQVGGSGYTANARFPYLSSELNTNTEANLVPWNLPATEWTGRLTPVTRDGANDWVETTTIPTADVAQEWKLADPRYNFTISANLRGAWNTTDLNNGNAINTILPLNQPYNTPAFGYAGTESVASIPNTNVVDWVLVQFRKPLSGQPADATSATEIGTKAAFLLRNGSIVDLDGVTPLTIDLRKQGAGFFVLRHRNHVSVMSNLLPSNVSGTFANDFKVLANAYNNVGITNAPMVAMPSSTQFGLWAGDANSDQGVNGSDLFVVRQRANLSSTGYEPADVNMDGGVNGSDLFLARQSANQAILTHSSRAGIPRLALVVNNPYPPTTHVPH